MKIRFKIFISILLTAIIISSAFLIIIPFESITQFVENNIIIFGIISASSLILISLTIFLLIIDIEKPLSRIKLFIRNINSGKSNQKTKLNTARKDNIGIISAELITLQKTLHNASLYAENLKSGKFEELEKHISSDAIIGKTLSEIQENLISIEKEKKYTVEENKKTQWFQNGIADFAKLLQQDFESTEDLASAAVKKLVKHLEVEQGGIFVLHENGEEKTLVLEAAYAFDKKKILDAEFEIGEGLVGKCAKDLKTIKIENLPEGYTFIGSGLGEDTPETLLLVPMMHENILFGVIEIASLYKIPDYKINFINAVGERIATEIYNLKTKLLTKTLAEDFKKQAEELALKEKETEQTINQLQKAKDKIAEQAAESNGILKALISVASVVFYDMEGRITNINQKNLELFNLKKEEQIGKTHFEILKEAKENPEWFEEFWNDLRKGKTRTKEYYIKNEDKEMWLLETFTPILNNEGKPEKVINIGIDITEQKLLEKQLNKQHK
ncbi:MAG: PAS domain-containing protein [Bacteroidales bacterium]|nr:PAS domain-containing protein [Bacteroidales bacterium]